MTDFEDVIHGWEIAPVTAIHPLRHVSDTAYWESGMYQAVDAARHIPKGGSVVDFGCGDGRVALPLARMGFQVTAVDAASAMLNRLRKRAKAEELPITTLKSNGLTLPTKLAEPVDAVVCRAVLIHHSHQDVALLVSALSKVIKRGGYLIADWPTGGHYVRQNWTDVTTWDPDHRLIVGEAAGLQLVEDDTPTVWKKL